jgi:hypothetical protein
MQTSQKQQQLKSKMVKFSILTFAGITTMTAGQNLTDSPICDNNSSIRNCDLCCAGVRKLTYQAPFGAGAYLAKVSQTFTSFEAFGPNACSNVGISPPISVSVPFSSEATVLTHVMTKQKLL